MRREEEDRQTQQSTVALANDATNNISTTKQTGANAETSEGSTSAAATGQTQDDGVPVIEAARTDHGSPVASATDVQASTTRSKHWQPHTPLPHHFNGRGTATACVQRLRCCIRDRRPVLSHAADASLPLLHDAATDLYDMLTDMVLQHGWTSKVIVSDSDARFIGWIPLRPSQPPTDLDRLAFRRRTPLPLRSQRHVSEAIHDSSHADNGSPTCDNGSPTRDDNTTTRDPGNKTPSYTQFTHP